MKKLLLSILTVILLLFSIALISCGDSVTTTTSTDVTTAESGGKIKAEDCLWYPKWNVMIKAKTADVKLIKLGTNQYHSSDFNDYISASVTDENDIEALVNALAGIELEAVDNSEFAYKGGIIAVIVNDSTEVRDSATNELIRDETDTYYAYAVELFVANDGYVYIIYTPNSQHREQPDLWASAPDEGKILFKSKTTVDY